MKYLDDLKKYRLFLLFFVCIQSCSNGSNSYLTLTEIKKTDEIDTIELLPKKQLYLIDIIRNRTFGRFTMNFAVVKQSLNRQLVYEFPENQNEIGKTFKNYILYFKSSTLHNQGWFNIRDGKITNSLPGITQIIENLYAHRQKDYLIKEVNGIIEIYFHGKLTSTSNYGNFITKEKFLDFNELPNKLYRLVGDSISVVSNNTDDLLKQRNGVFFMPPPGYGIVRKFDKRIIYKKVDSVSYLDHLPNKIPI